MHYSIYMIARGTLPFILAFRSVMRMLLIIFCSGWLRGKPSFLFLFSIFSSHSFCFLVYYFRDEMSLQYSPMSEDFDDSRFCETPTNACSPQSESLPSSPVSPCRYQRPLGGFSSAPYSSSFLSHGCSVTSATYSQPRQRGSDSEGRFPSSPSDICHSADLRRTALLRSVQMRTQPLGSSSFELPFDSGHEPGSNIEAEERPCSYMKSLVEEREYALEECSSMSISEPGFNEEKACRVLNMNIKGDGSGV